MRLLTVLLTALALGLAACGGDDDEPAPGATSETPAQPAETEPAPSENEAGGGGGGSGELTLSADEQQLAFDKDALTASAGSVTITMENPSSIPHNVAIKGDGVDEKGEVVQKGGTSTVTAELEAGSYTFYCSVGGHEAAGMKGTLTVE